MIDKNKLKKTVKDMIGEGKVIMAMDESIGTIDKRLKAVGVEPNEENRQKWRELIVTNPDLTGVGGAILYEGTVFQEINGKPVYQILEERGIVPGLKVDEGKKPLIGEHNENNTLGLDTLHEKLEKYGKAVRFAKWRSELKISDNTPTSQAITANAYGLAVYASICQNYGIVPIVEPEILIKGDHDIDDAYMVAQHVLSIVFNKLDEMGVYLPGTILKPSMVTPGDQYKGKKVSPEDVAISTIEAFLDVVPSNLGGISFLSGGLSDLDAVRYLNALNSEENRKRSPWRLTASYGRAEIGEGLVEWKGLDKNVRSAQKIITERTTACGMASEGKLPDNFNYSLKAK